MKFNLVILSLFLSFFSFAQNGEIKGTVLDKDLKNEPLSFANVNFKGTNIATSTDIDGKYVIGAPAGDYIIVFSFAGYESKEIPVTIIANEVKTLDNIIIGTTSVSLEDVVIKATTSREKESALLLEQKKAVEIKQSIGSQEMSRKGVSDVAAAVTKTTGITKQEGSGNIFVRGLGDRYNSTTMNGLPIPSDDPENKNINLEIFSTDIVEFVSIDKVYNTRLFGDYAGGNVDINSKEYKGKGFLSLETGVKANTNAFAEDSFALQTGFNKYGFTERKMPANPLTKYNFKSLQLDEKTPISESYGIAAGESFNIGKEGRLFFFATASFDNDFTSKRNGSSKSGVNDKGIANKNFFKYSAIGYSTNTTGMANVGYKINNNHKLNFNSLFINTSSQTKSEWTGFIVDIAEDNNGFQRRSTNTKNNILINQVLGDHKIGNRLNFNWGASYNTTNGSVPDRTQNILKKGDLGYTLSAVSRPDNQRYFQDLTENEMAGSAIIDYKLFKNSETSDYSGKVTLGFNTRIKDRSFKARQFNFEANTGFTTFIVDPNNLDLFYNQDNFTNGFFEISTFRGGPQFDGSLVPQSYNGDQTINAGFINFEYKIGKLTAVAGARGEQIEQKVNWNTQLSGKGKDKLKKTAFLPSLIAKYEINDKQNIRLGASKSYTLPQFKERVPFIFEDDDLQVKYGNKDLYASDNYNFDLKWELFPKSEELLSVTAFGKYIQNPINEVIVLSSSNDISYVNTGDFGTALGAELEYRKVLFNFEKGNAKKLSGGINASYLKTEQEYSAEKVDKETEYQADFTNKKGRFTGASDLLLNADLTFFTESKNKESNLNTTLSYSYFSDRVSAIGTNQKGDLVDKAFGSLDFIVKSKITKQFGVGLVAKNLLDPKIQRVQENVSGDITTLSYTKGMNFSLNFNYQF